jgi:hypothetical protein
MALVPAFAQRKQQKPPRPPDVANHSYGAHERNVLDLWKAKSGGPTPLVIYIHGGAFAHGDKSQIESLVLEKCLSRGISVASINYRFSSDAPYPAPFLDAARAVQYLRLHASEWNLDKRAFAATGGSAGAGISLWLGFHDDLADPSSADPLRRQSTRLSAMAVRNGQTTYDLRTIATLIDPETARIEPLRQLFAVKSGVDPLQATEAFKNYEDSSAVTHLTRDDPPVLLMYAQNNTPMPPSSPGNGIHHPRFGYFLKERMDKLGIECVVKVKQDYEGKPAGQREIDIVEFLARHLQRAEMPR